MAKNDYLDHLASVPLFSACSKKELQKIAKASDEIDIPEGKDIATQDEPGREAFVIVEGSAVVRRNNRKIAEVGPGDVVGQLSLIDKGPRTATVTAASPMKVLVLGPREFSALLDEVPTISHKMMRAMAGMIRELDKKQYG